MHFFLVPQAIAVEIKHDDKLKEGEEACFQVMIFILSCIPKLASFLSNSGCSVVYKRVWSETTENTQLSSEYF